MKNRITRPTPPPRPVTPGSEDGKDGPERLRLARITLLKNSIRKGLYDVDGKIEGIIEEVVRNGS